MAASYGLKYTQYLEKGGARLQIRVYAKGWSGATYGMANVTGAAMQIVGGQSDVLSPIIKTSFSWSLADAWDMGSTQADGTQCVNVANEKCGRWEEFYTQDATKYRVELWATPAGGSAARIWSGYVTPDSWSENLVYRGSVTITARDMLGALKDKEFNLTGRVSVLDVVQGALAACECPMLLTYTAAHFLHNSNGQSILQHTFAASTFSGDTWQTALEEVLESLGLVLRYNGADGIVLTSLRYLREDTTAGTHALEYTGRTGLRELDPALKLIEETFSIDFEAQTPADPDATRFSPSGLLMQQNKVFNTNYPATRFDITQYALTAPLSGGLYGNLAVPAPATLEDGVPARTFFVPTDIVNRGSASGYSTANSLAFKDSRIFAPFRAIISVDGPMLKYWPANGGRVAPVSSYFTFQVAEIKVRITAAVGGAARYLGPDGWSADVQEFAIQSGQEIEVPALENGTDFTVQVWEVNTDGAGQEWEQHITPPNDFFFCTALTIRVEPPTTSTTPTEFKTTTIYNEDNNVTISRTPKVGPANTDVAAAFCRNVLAYGNNVAPDEWNWPGASSYLPLAVMIQAQVLCYHAAAVSVFTGTAHDKATPRALPFPGPAYTYYQRDCLQIYGTYDFASGFIGQSLIREVLSWEDVWGASFEPDYTQTSGAGKGSTSATGAGGSSVSPGGSGGGGGGGATPSFFEIDPDYDGGVHLKSNYAALRFPALRLGAGDTDPDLEIITVNGIRCLHTPLPVLSDQDISGFWDGGSPGGGGSDFDEAAMWVALGTTINVKKISSQYLPAAPVTSVAGYTGGVTADQIANALTVAGYKLTDTIVTSLPWTSITGRPTAVSAFTNDAGYITASALNGYATQVWVQSQGYATTSALNAAAERLALAVAANADRLASLEDMLDEPVFGGLFASTVHAGAVHADEVLLGPMRLYCENVGTDADPVWALRVNGHVLGDGDVSGFYAGGTPGGGGGGSFDEAAMWVALGTTITAQVIDVSHIPSITTSKISNLEAWISGKGYATTAALSETSGLLARAVAENSARLDSIDDVLEDIAPALRLYTDTVVGDTRLPLERSLAGAIARLDALEAAYQEAVFGHVTATTIGVDNFWVRSTAWVGGNVFANGDVGGFYGSDRALKDDIRDFSCKSAADILRRIRLVSFTWNARASRLNADNVGEDFGVIAQEVEAACPRMVRRGHYGEDLLGVDYSKHLPSVLLGGWHDHERRIAALERENKQLKEKLRQNGCI